ncbi:MAG: hypothetical protein AAFO69_08035 [Bacteroidota bacterium]
MEVDHIFIFSRLFGDEADELAQFGLIEGSSRVHPGQGTTNRKFYFSNFFLEILWVHDKEEIRSPGTVVTNLWKRSGFADNGFSPYGLCLVNNETTQNVFAKSSEYQPEYFPEGMVIDFIDEESQPSLPWLFRLPFKGPKKPTTEPTNHPIGIKKLTKAVFNIPGKSSLTELLSHGQVDFVKGEYPMLTLQFDHGQAEKHHRFQSLPLEISW